MPIEGLDLVITAAFVGVFVLPALVHLASDLWQRRGRSFSLIPHKKRHLAVSIVRFGLVYGAGVLSTEAPEARALIWPILGVVLLVFVAVGATARRLTINAETGLVKWRRISLPWWPSTHRNTGFVDRVRKLDFKSNKQTQSLLGVGELKESWTSSYNGNVSTSGHYSDRTMAWIAEEVNGYLEAFRRHDTDTARATRDRFCEQFEAANAPRRKREAERAKSAQRAKADKKKRKKARRAAKVAEKERKRARRVEDKFKA